MAKRWMASAQAEAAGQLNLVLDFPVPKMRATDRLPRAVAKPEAGPKAGSDVPAHRVLPETNAPPGGKGLPFSPQRSDTILKLPAVKAKTGLSRSSIYALIEKGEFPAQVRLGPMSVGWSEAEVDGWVDARKRQRAQNG